MRFETNPTTATTYVVGRDSWHDEHVADALADRPVVAVIDREVLVHHRAAVDARLRRTDCLARIEVEGGESCKTREQLDALLAAFEREGLPKHGLVLAIGGGTVCDVAGLAALLMRRSVPLALLPTTLLAQVDAAVGGKNGINSDTTKNMIGHFHHPLVVASDPGLIASLDRRQVVSGLAECIKVFAVADSGALERHEGVFASPDLATVDDWTAVVSDAQHHKLVLLADDPYEASSRRLLNYGHAFAHLLEEQSRFQLLHGEAVLFGMLIENEVSVALGLASEAMDELQRRIVDLVPPAAMRHWIPFAAIEAELDKIRHMRRAAMNLVCVRTPGTATIVDDVDDDLLAHAWRSSEDRLCAVADEVGADA